MKKRFVLTVMFCWLLCAWTLQPPTASAKELGIGSQAPPLDIEHWIQDGNGFFKPVKEFEPGKVYVVEFWATWCGPCIMSMPHLAELQNEYRGRDVQIISVSDETTDEVNDLLAKDSEEEGKTFAEITAAYSLTTDPDRSVYEDYMEAANQEGIPTSFIVGKSGLIEWIGHPLDLDEPLEAVVTDSWDRKAFKEQLEIEQDFKKNMERISMLANAGRFADALKVIDGQIENLKNDAMLDQLTAIRNSLKLSAGLLDEEALAYYRGKIAEMKGDAYSIGRFGYSIYGQIQEGVDVGPLAADAIAAIEREVDAAEDEIKPLLYNTIALLNNATGNIEAAIKAQQAAIDASDDDRKKRRLTPFLEELKEKAGETKAEPAEQKEE